MKVTEGRAKTSQGHLVMPEIREVLKNERGVPKVRRLWIWVRQRSMRQTKVPTGIRRKPKKTRNHQFKGFRGSLKHREQEQLICRRVILT